MNVKLYQKYKDQIELVKVALKNYHKRVNHSTIDNMLAVNASFHVYALKC